MVYGSKEATCLTVLKKRNEEEAMWNTSLLIGNC